MTRILTNFRGGATTKQTRFLVHFVLGSKNDSSPLCSGEFEAGCQRRPIEHRSVLIPSLLSTPPCWPLSTLGDLGAEFFRACFCHFLSTRRFSCAVNPEFPPPGAPACPACPPRVVSSSLGRQMAHRNVILRLDSLIFVVVVWRIPCRSFFAAEKIPFPAPAAPATAAGIAASCQRRKHLLCLLSHLFSSVFCHLIARSWISTSLRLARVALSSSSLLSKSSFRRFRHESAWVMPSWLR